jgi:hypothetical protein
MGLLTAAKTQQLKALFFCGVRSRAPVSGATGHMCRDKRFNMKMEEKEDVKFR